MAFRPRYVLKSSVENPTESSNPNPSNGEVQETHDEPREGSQFQHFQQPQRPRRQSPYVGHPHEYQQRSPPRLSQRAMDESQDDEAEGEGEEESQNVAQKNKIDLGCTCLICDEAIEIAAVYSCNHVVCHTCALRMRVKFSRDTCCVCNTTTEKLVLTQNLPPLPPPAPADSKPPPKGKAGGPKASTPSSQSVDRLSLVKFDELSPKCQFVDSEWNIATDDPQILRRIRSMREIVCPKCPYGPAFHDLSELKAHVQIRHRLQFCDLCLESRSNFLFEQILYTRRELEQHFSMTQTCLKDPKQFRGHPQCEFCQTSFYDNDPLFEHMQKSHETCHICEKHGFDFTYYKNAGTLEAHFREDHVFCPEPNCPVSIFERVFQDASGLHSHQLAYHSKGGIVARGNLAGIEIGFQYESQRDRDYRNRRGRGRSDRRFGGRGYSASAGMEASGALDDERINEEEDERVHRDFYQTGGSGGGGAGGNRRENNNNANREFRITFNHGTGVSRSPNLSNFRLANNNTTSTRPNNLSSPNQPIPAETFEGRSGGGEQPTRVSPVREAGRPVSPLGPSQSPAAAPASAFSSLADAGRATSSSSPIPGPSTSSAPSPPPPSRSPDPVTTAPAQLSLKERNAQLTQKMKTILGTDRFTEFKALSSKFLQGELLCADYYKQFMAFFGDKHIDDVFPDLVELLPDQNKRDGLMMAHNHYHSKEFGVPSAKKATQAQPKKKLEKKAAPQPKPEPKPTAPPQWPALPSASSSLIPPPSAFSIASPPPQPKPSAKASAKPGPKPSFPLAVPVAPAVEEFPSLPSKAAAKGKGKGKAKTSQPQQAGASASNPWFQNSMHKHNVLSKY